METTLIDGIRMLLELLFFLGLFILDGAVIIIICIVAIVLCAAIIGAFTENDSDSDNQNQSKEA